MARTNTFRPFLIRKEVYRFLSTAVAPDATVELVTCAPLAYHPSWPITEVKIAYTFIGAAVDAGGGSNPQVQMVSDPTGTPQVRGQSIVFPLLASVGLPWGWAFFGDGPDSPAFDDGQTLQLQGLNPAGGGNVSIDGVLTLEVFAQEAP